jgi:hypothetical protein
MDDNINDKPVQKVQKWIYFYEFLGSAALIYAFNIKSLETLEGKSERAIAFGCMFTAISIIFGQI